MKQHLGFTRPSAQQLGDTDREMTLLLAPDYLLSEDLVYENMREPEPEDCIQARDLMIQ